VGTDDFLVTADEKNQKFFHKRLSLKNTTPKTSVWRK